MLRGRRLRCPAARVLVWLSLQALFMQASGQTFTSQRAAASLCNTADCLDFKLVLADFGVYPYGQLFECVSAGFELRACITGMLPL